MLAEILHKNGITHVYCVGLAFDYCVGFSALDSKEAGYKTFVIEDATRGVSPDSSTCMRQKLLDKGIQLIDSSLLLSKAATKISQ